MSVGVGLERRRRGAGAGGVPELAQAGQGMRGALTTIGPVPRCAVRRAPRVRPLGSCLAVLGSRCPGSQGAHRGGDEAGERDADEQARQASPMLTRVLIAFTIDSLNCSVSFLSGSSEEDRLRRTGA